MRDQILQALESSQADYTDIRLEQEWRTQVIYHGKDLENLEASVERGGIVRCLVGGGWGIAVFNSLDQLQQRVDDAYHIAKTVSAKASEKVELAPVEPVQDEVRVVLAQDPRSVPLQQKQAIVQAYNEMMLKHSDKIISTKTYYTDSFQEVTIATSEGAFIIEERPDVVLSLWATARQGDANIQTAFESLGWAAGLEAVEGREAEAQKVAQRALDLLDARSVKGGNYTAILDPFLTGVFIHEAFGHLCEADFISKNPRFLEILKTGRQFGVPELDVVEDGYLPGLRGNFKYDDEGVPRRKINLVKDGVLQGFMHSRETAARMGVEPTGNARAISYSFQPIVRMRNTYVDQGSAVFDDMLKGIDYGVYACKAFGGQTAAEQFTFSAAFAYEIVNGQIGDMLRDVVLTGNIFETMQNIDMIGNDLDVLSGGGGCGKGGQYPLPVSFGGPHVRIQNLTIGGRAA